MESEHWFVKRPVFEISAWLRQSIRRHVLNQALGLRILRVALKAGGNLPKRTYESVEQFKEHWSEEDSIFIDATEQRRQRPSDKEEQKDDYSGKKKRIP